MVLDSSGTVTYLPLPFFVNKALPHAPHALWEGEAIFVPFGKVLGLDFGVGVFRLLNGSSSSSVVSEFGYRRWVEVKTSFLYDGMLNVGGEEGAEDSVKVSEKSDVRSGVEGTEESVSA